jgi:hypothetical protein
MEPFVVVLAVVGGGGLLGLEGTLRRRGGLGRVGTVGAVLPLKEAAAHSDASAALQRAVRQAVAEIESRLSGASPGQLSLAPGDAGRVSLVDTSDGAVSLPTDAPTGSRGD